MQPPRSSSTRMGFGGAAATLILNLNGVRRLDTFLKRIEAEDREKRPERLSSTNMASQVRGLKQKTAEAGTRPVHLSSTKMGLQVLKQKTAEAGTRPEHSSSIKIGLQLRGFKLRRRRKRGRGRSAYPRDYPQPRQGFRCVVSSREHGRGGDEAGALILNQYGVSGA